MLNQNIHDTVRIDVLNKLSIELKNTDPSRSVEYSKTAISLSERIKDQKALARSMHTLGNIYYVQANHTEALKFYLQAIKIREQLKDSFNLSKGFNNVALIHADQGNFEEAIRFHNKSVAIKLARNDQPGLASSYGNLGIVYHQLAIKADSRRMRKQADSLFSLAEVYHKRSFNIQDKLVAQNPSNPNHQLSLAATFNNLGNTIYERAAINNNDPQMLREARIHHEKALIIQEMFEDQRGVSHSHINLAAIFEKLGDYNKAENEYQLASEIAEPLNFREEKKVIYKGLSTIYELKGDHRKGLEYFKKYSIEKDSILDLTKQEQISELQERFNAKDKEREIQLLNNNKKISEAELEKQKVLKRAITVGLVLTIALVILVIVLLFILWNRYKLKEQVTTTLEHQNALIQEKNKEITDSIKYAKRIQEAFLPPEHQLKHLLPESFIFYKPKDIISGDFYWVEEWGKKTLIAVADCTGHGVPGAFMSVVGYNLLNQAVNVYGLDKPALILNHMNKWLYKILHQTYEDSTVKDGMDICLIALDKEAMTVEYAGAFNPLWILRGTELIELKGNKFPIGAFVGDELRNFNSHEVSIQKGDQLYLFSDGFADQFGGPKGKKFKYKQLLQTIQNLAKERMENQKTGIEKAFEDWKGNYEQIDDVCVLGFRVN